MQRLFPLLGSFVLVTALLLSGCADSRQDVRSVTRTFIDASERGDTATAQSVVTKKAQQIFSSSNVNEEHKDEKKTETTAGFQVGEPVIHETEATVPVTMTDDNGTQEVKVRLRNEDGKWRVYAMQVPTYPGGPTVTMDYENPMSVIPQGMHAAGMIFGQATKGFELGMKEFAKGFEQGYEKPVSPDTPSATPSPKVTVEEVH